MESIATANCEPNGDVLISDEPQYFTATLLNLAPLGLLALGSCAIFGPLTDPKLQRAPFSACFRFPDGASPGAATTAPDRNCLTVHYKRSGSEDERLGPLDAGAELILKPITSPGCLGDYTHLVVTGSSPGAGAMLLEANDTFARGPVSRTFKWNQPKSDNSWVLPSIGSALRHPGSIRLKVLEGTLFPKQICLKSYHT